MQSAPPASHQTRVTLPARAALLVLCTRKLSVLFTSSRVVPTQSMKSIATPGEPEKPPASVGAAEEEEVVLRPDHSRKLEGTRSRLSTPTPRTPCVIQVPI